MVAEQPDTITEIIPYIYYRDVAGALDWLARAFGFVEIMRKQTPSGGMHGEMMLDGRQIMLGQSPDGGPPAGAAPTQGVFVYLSDVDAHHRRAVEAGARIEKAPEDLPYGRSYSVRDFEGHPWFFTTPPGRK
jgi:PhnB protein